jgi:hypothetical protein
MIEIFKFHPDTQTVQELLRILDPFQAGLNFQEPAALEQYGPLQLSSD